CATKRRRALIHLSCRALQSRYRPRGPIHRHNARIPVVAGPRVKVGGYQPRISPEKASPAGRARPWAGVVESRSPWVNTPSIVGENTRKRQSDVSIRVGWFMTDTTEFRA